MASRHDEAVRREFQIIHDIGVVYQRWVTSHCVPTAESVEEIRKIMARDPDVQAMVLRAAKEIFDALAEKLDDHNIGQAGGACAGLAIDIENGVLRLEIPE